MEEIRFPRLGWSMEEGRFVGWIKKSGDRIKVGDVLFEMEGEKALQEIESVGNGTLYIPDSSPQPGSTVVVGELLGYLLSDGENPPVKSEAPHSAGPAEDSMHDSVSKIQMPSATDASVPTEMDDKGNGVEERIATPRARRLARSQNIDWRALQGSGRGGRIREADVLRKIEAALPVRERNINDSENCFTPRRKAIAERLRKSLSRTVPVTLTTVVDVTALVNYRQVQKKLQSQVIPSFTDLFAKYVALVLAKHPAMSLLWNDTLDRLTRVAPEDFHVGIAVDTQDGLLVPVVRNVFSMPLEEIAGHSKKLIEKARSGRLVAAEMADAVITISNLGGFGIDGFTPIVNLPQISILGLGAIRREPVVTGEGTIVVRDRMVLSLTFDHSAVDGAPAAAFLRDLVQEIDNHSR